VGKGKGGGGGGGGDGGGAKAVAAVATMGMVGKGAAAERRRRRGGGGDDEGGPGGQVRYLDGGHTSVLPQGLGLAWQSNSQGWLNQPSAAGEADSLSAD
jgi:hypothetical protein